MSTPHLTLHRPRPDPSDSRVLRWPLEIEGLPGIPWRMAEVRTWTPAEWAALHECERPAGTQTTAGGVRVSLRIE